MSSDTIATVVKMLESLPESLQEKAAERLREYVEDLQDEAQWDRSLQKTQRQLVARAQQAKKEIADGRAEPLDYDQL